MNLNAYISKDYLSHAYVIEGERVQGLLALRSLMESFGIATIANPDYHEIEIETLLLEHAQEIRREQGMHASEGAKKIFVIAFNSIIIESQNALLKTLEEPTDNTHFFFLVRTSEILLPTVRSRMQLIRPDDDDVDVLPLAKEFLGSTPSVRMKLIETMTKAKADDKPRAKEDARVFVGALESLLYGGLEKGGRRVAIALEDILTAKHELSGRAPSVKLLLEHLALTLPTP